jgi:hypothetical protein
MGFSPFKKGHFALAGKRKQPTCRVSPMQNGPFFTPRWINADRLGCNLDDKMADRHAVFSVFA